MKFFALFGPRLEAPAGAHANRQTQAHLLERRERDVERRELDAESHARVRAAQLDRSQAILTAARARDDAADAQDALADQRERDLDMAHMLSTANDMPYGADWPDRRHAVLHRERAKADRQSAHADLVALITDLG
ncbi:MAG: hypothetical protein ABIN55_01170 [Aeromicrobium sp.]